MSSHPFRIARSRTGLGMFATEAIPKNRRIVEYTGTKLRNDFVEKMPGRPRYLYDLNSRYTIDGSPRSNLGRYANHSCRPNAEIIEYRGRVWVKSKRAIQPGEEVTYNYGKAYFDEFIGKNCRCAKCEGSRAPQKYVAERVRSESKRQQKRK